MDTRFHCVYLLTSLDPQCVGEYYVGYTVNPIRRLRQHNGELVSGAWRTKRRGRPWELVCCVSGFGEDRIALKFEWCWQHPTKSTHLKAQMPQLRGVHRLPYAIGVLHLLLQADLFVRLQLTLHIFEPMRFWQVVAELQRRSPSLPQLAETSLLRIEEIAKERFVTHYLAGAEGGGDVAMDSCIYFITAQLGGNPVSQLDVDSSGRRMRGCGYLSEEEVLRQHVRVKELLEANQCPCSLCSLPLRSPYFVRCARTPFCALRAHLTCLAMWFTHDSLRKRDLVTDVSTRRACNGGNCNTQRDNNGSDDAVDTFLSARPLTSLAVNSADDRSTTSAAPSVDLSYNVSLSRATLCGSSRSLTLLPCQPSPCPLCDEPLQWGALVHDLKRRAVVERRLVERQRREKMDAALAERLRRIESNSLVERQCHPLPTPAAGPRRPRGRCHDDAVAGGGKDAVANQQDRVLEGAPHSNINDSTISFSLPLCGEEESLCGNSRRGVAPVEPAAQAMMGRRYDSLSDLCDSVLQLTEFNVEDWLDA
ncbi:putative structure-specific endonuclease [Trypanosoma rangeli]|uniref:Structure-specific endonuclease subunit SLX1 homolog n=1 Tax=Trypanosoma rangeli TaxID=5698 RepID=A0A422P230_TRYRA|nr:putative structure-specific endonuclease [Trypanosoma rangeli]RNF11759.1 putative structure-specific endonuclease [Trypanosoma rangeli]|eukprot:RNF11759.1 putative structure-specific endonuclease [Trypanosoma rangeli]